jgi:hypothetical protein
MILSYRKTSLSHFTDDELSNSVFYGAAGIDIQTLLRFGDFYRDFIYVNADIDYIDFIDGGSHCVAGISEQHPRLLTLKEIARVLPPPGPHRLPLPDFIDERLQAMNFGINGIYHAFSRAMEYYECQELYIPEFARNFVPTGGIYFELDVFYKWPLEYKRQF